MASSFLHGENAPDLGNIFTMFDSIGQNTEGERLRLRHCFVASSSVGQYSGQVRNFADPATVFLPIDLYSELVHKLMLQPG